MSDSNDRNLTCPNGHTFESDAQTASGESLVCPECGSEVTIINDSSPGPARSLWEVMGRRSDDEDSSEAGFADDIPASSSQDSEEESTGNQPAVGERPRGLWAMMGTVQPTVTTSTEDGEAENIAAEFEFAEASEDPGEGGDLFDEEAGESETDNPNDDDPDNDFSLADDDEEDGWDVDSPLHDFDAADSSLSADVSPADSSDQTKLPRGTGAIVAGVLSVFLSGLNLLPFMAAKFPASIVGAYALLLGYQALGSNRRQRETITQLLAQAGMLLGLVGIFAGPAYLNELGESWRNRSAREVIESNLGGIHQALNDYALEKGHFPAGGTFAVDEEGLEVGMHSWMTTLLPYLGYTDIYNEIDQASPWDDAANVPPMRHPVSEFLTPTVKYEPTAQGYATAHFSGVGGIIQTEQGLLPTGIFEKNSGIRIDDVTDGLSQTLIAGEIARALPAWGDPENWRTVEGPLNQRLSSFGNAAGTGAYFLQGDGSVRFFSNRTSPEVLQRLSTRNAGD